MFIVNGPIVIGTAKQKPAATAIVSPCRWLGEIVEHCPRGDADLNVHWCKCEAHDVDRCTIGANRKRIHSCHGCHFRNYIGPAPAPLIRFDEKNLFPEVSGLRFNSSLIEYGDGYALAFRTGWRGSDIYIATLSAEFTPQTVAKLNLSHRAADWGREDPRLFWYRGQLHVMFIGVVGLNGPTNVLYARLGDGFKVEAIHHPHYPARNSWEKNWQFFEHDGELFAVYSVAPHKILRIQGDSAELAYETGTPAPWNPGTEIRGGAAPVRIGDEWYCFFHSRDSNRVYNAGLYTFEARPPFRVTRIIPAPILIADPSTKPRGQYTPVVFPCGAVRRGDEWVISMGVHDRWTELRTFDASDLERRLERIAPPATWSCHPWPAIDGDVFADVARSNEYRLPESFAPDDRVIDCGAHVGSFAHAAWLRGSRRIECYEPSPANLKHLRLNAANMPGVEVNAAAIGTGPLYWRPSTNANDTGGGACAGNDVLGCDVQQMSSKSSKCPASSLQTGASVNTRSLDETIGTDPVAFLKLDIEGGELNALPSATRLHLVDRIAIEWHPPGGPEMLADVLRRAGFTVESVPTTDGRGLMFGYRE